MVFDAGHPKLGGRRQGVPNKVSGEVKSMVLEALRLKGGIEYLQRQADENPTAFMALLGKLLPKQVDLQPEGSAPVRIVVVTGVPRGTQMISETRGSLLGDPTDGRTGAS
jgi:hypothetical protein